MNYKKLDFILTLLELISATATAPFAQHTNESPFCPLSFENDWLKNIILRILGVFFCVLSIESIYQFLKDL